MALSLGWLQAIWKAAFIAGSLSSLAWLGRAVLKFTKPPEVDISKYVLQPEYSSKRGVYSQIEEDLKHALELLADETHPPVIFIDDLDRCPPQIVADLVEAINLFISGDMSSCFFIIGHDAQIVAATLDYAYQNVAAKTTHIEKHHSSIGWFFMEKFIQLQLSIPGLPAGKSKKVLNALMDIEEDGPAYTKEEQEQLLLSYANLSAKIDTSDLEDIFDEEKATLESKIQTFNKASVRDIQMKVIDHAINNYKIDGELNSVLDWVGPYLCHSPREIKRYTNLYIFYNIFKYTEQGSGIRNANPDDLASWLLIMIRWPQIVRAIQWDAEKEFFSGDTPFIRANNFDNMITKASDHAKFKKTYRKRARYYADLAR